MDLASFSGRGADKKPRNTYKSLLHTLSTEGLTSTLQMIYDGGGQSTPLSLSTTAVKVGNLTVTDSVITSSTKYIRLATDGYFQLHNRDEPDPPDNLYGAVYMHADKLFFKDYNGVVYDLTTGSGGSSSWGNITGTLSDQTDLQSALNSKVDSSSLGTMALEDTTDYSPTSAYSTVAFSGSYNDLENLPAFQALAFKSTVDNGDWSGTALAVSNGGTGATDASGARTNLGLTIGTDVQAYHQNLKDISDLTDPNADRLLFWDDSDGKYTHLTLGTNLAISGTTLNASGAGVATWGSITGTLSDQTDLQSALNAKVNVTALGAVATSNDYDDLDNLPDLSGYFLTANFSSTFDSNLVTKSTTNLAEGTNLYYTDTRFDTRLGTKTTDNLSEGSTNKYYTDEKVDDRVAALIQNGTGITWSYNDSLNTLTPTVTITQYTDEMAQDAVGGILTSGTYVNATYNDGANTITVNLSATGTPDGTKFLRDDNTWATPSGGGMSDPTTTDGDIIIRASGTTTRLGIGSTNQVLTVKSGLPSWEAAPGGFNRYTYETSTVGSTLRVYEATNNGTNYTDLRMIASSASNTTIIIPSGSAYNNQQLAVVQSGVTYSPTPSHRLAISPGANQSMTQAAITAIDLGLLQNLWGRRISSYYGTIGASGIDVSTPGLVPVSNTTYLFPIYIPIQCTSIKFGIQTAQASGAGIQFNLYPPDPNYFSSTYRVTNSPVLSAVTVNAASLTTTGVKTVNMALRPGYWLLSMRCTGITDLVLSAPKTTDPAISRHFFGIGNNPEAETLCYGWYYTSTASANAALGSVDVSGEITSPVGINIQAS